MSAAVSKYKSTILSLESFSQFYDMLSPVLSSVLGTTWRLIPTASKYLLFAILLVNVRSWPLMWHCKCNTFSNNDVCLRTTVRVFTPVIKLQLRHKLLKWRTICWSRTDQNIAEDKWLDSITPIGQNPFDSTTSYTSWASEYCLTVVTCPMLTSTTPELGIDDSDFNSHLSNSSYAKVCQGQLLQHTEGLSIYQTMDSARFKAGIRMFPQFFRAGGWIALAATHYNFLREIPILANYEVRVHLGSWDEKWVCRLLNFPSPTHKWCRYMLSPSSSPNLLKQNPNTCNMPHQRHIRQTKMLLATFSMQTSGPPSNYQHHPPPSPRQKHPLKPRLTSRLSLHH